MLLNLPLWRVYLIRYIALMHSLPTDFDIMLMINVSYLKRGSFATTVGNVVLFSLLPSQGLISI